jgi:hypothetical protein
MSTVDMLVPDGRLSNPGTRPVRLAERGHTRFPLEGVITMVLQGGTAKPELLGLELTVVTEAVDVTCGEKAVLTVRATSTATDDIDGEAMVVSPWGTWHLIDPYTNGLHVPAGASAEVSFEVVAPAHAQPGTWWAMVKLAWSGRVQYSPAIPVRVHLP